MITAEQSLQIIQLAKPLNRWEKISLNNSYGRILAQDIVADIDQPPFDKSAMDGYACRREDLPGPLIVDGQIAAGNFSTEKLLPLHCLRIFTGAPIPENSNCVIMQEYVKNLENGTILFSELETKNNICYKGEDIKIGEIAIQKGVLIQPQHIAIMASFGIMQPLVSQMPRIAIICSGSELVEPDIKPYNAFIRNSNAYQLMGQISALNLNADYFGIVSDSKESLVNKVSDLTNKYDVIIVTGGASVGDYDFMPEALLALNANIHFSELNIQPGKPVIYATLENCHILGLSGNPVSSYIQFLLVAKPLLLQLMGAKNIYWNINKMILEGNIKRKKGKRQLYTPISILNNGKAKLIPFNGSAHIAALKNANGFAILEPEVNELKENELVNVILI